MIVWTCKRECEMTGGNNVMGKTWITIIVELRLSRKWGGGIMMTVKKLVGYDDDTLILYILSLYIYWSLC